MKHTAKLVLLLVMVVVVVTLAPTFYYFIKGYYPPKYGTISSMGEIPMLGNVFADVKNVDEVRYAIYPRWRTDDIWVTGQASTGDGREFANGWPHCEYWQGSHEQPPEDIAKVMAQLDPPALKAWSKEYWILRGGVEGQVRYSAAFDSGTRRFWSCIIRIHGPLTED